MTTAQPGRWANWIGGLISVCVLALVLQHVRIGWDSPITEAHAWRQTQTAVTAYYLVGHPFHLAYETPLLGPPWSTPMEFPLYQLATARLVDLTSMNLVSAGRTVGLFCFFVAAVPLWGIARILSGSPTLAVGGATLFLSSSFYGFWSRTFMIESTSLLFSLAFLWAFMTAWNRRSWRWAVLAMGLGALAGLAKSTSFALFMAAAVIFAVSTRWRCWRESLSSEGFTRTIRLASREVVLMIVILGGALTATAWWVSYSDGIKAENPLAVGLVSNALSSWNFGTWDQKLDLATWKLIAGRALASIGERIPVLVLLSIAATAVWSSGRYRFTFLACLGLFLLGPLVFTNLYYVHDYYFNANLIFGLGALWFGSLALIQSEHVSVRIAGGIFLLFCVVVQLVDYPRRYESLIASNPDDENTAFLKMAERVRKTTPAGSSIVWITTKAAPVVPFYGERRALCLTPGPETAATSQAVQNLTGHQVSAIVNSAEDLVTEAWVLRLLKESGAAPIVMRP
ncbi:MAG TPA: glycosyltransferase family 39 protein [Chthoniobacterales bacterium]